jgi:hypothetical protein
MKKLARFALFVLGSALVLVTLVNSAAAQRLQRESLDAAGNKVIKLFAINKYHWKASGCLDLGAVPDCQLRYGSLYAGDDWDWFQSSVGQTDRTAIRDLGLLNWTDAFTVPVVRPFPKLKPGEQRHITVDTSGADGADGANGARGQDGADADGVVRLKPGADVYAAPLPSRPKHDGRPKIDPVYAKVIPGHMYVVHVVTETSDFYALVRVEEVEKGDNCTVSWRLIPAPEGDSKLATN